MLPSIDIAPGQYLVLAREANTFANGGVAPRLVYGNSIVLNEKNDRLILRDTGAIERRRHRAISGFNITLG